ncbi:SGNH/GDSL hydrolase family protein [Neobacillus mesonae]|uniref:SGNH/GDSL hydrolase family protein n=1 Tax=Neobacillus mesonae TaxID=1193713 RepID=UPI00083627D8|nr:SGNH/GDSL hydrolase family protein [Neobacillus mesonae]
MKKILTLLLGVVFLAVLYLGQSHWNEQQQAAKGAEKVVKQESADVQGEEAADDSSTEKLLALTKNWPADAVEQLKVSLEEKKPFKILFVGSPAIGSKETGPFADVKARLVKAFGEEHIEVGLHTYDSTSTQFLKDSQEDEIAAEAADLIVLEPLILKNNDAGVTNNTLTDLRKIVDEVKTVVPDTSFIIQPSYPLYKAKNYPKQVAALKKYAEEQELPYLDHWQAWPDSNSSELKDYMQPDLSAPNEKGNKLWSDYLTDYLISDGSESE